MTNLLEKEEDAMEDEGGVEQASINQALKEWCGELLKSLLSYWRGK